MQKNILLLVAVIALALPSSRAETIIVLTSGNQLLTIDSATPATVIKTVSIAGLPPTEALLAIDFRPSTGALYALGVSNRLYVIDTVNGVATPIGPGSAFTLNGRSFGFDFNPVVDLIRVTSDQEQNIRLNPSTGATAATDTNLAYATGDPNVGQNPNVVGSAYTNNVAGATETTLYDIDSTLHVLVKQDPPNSGMLNTVGPLGVNTRDAVGFDISPTTGVAYASLIVDPPAPSPQGVPAPNAALYIINLSTGAATAVGPISSTILLENDTIIDIAVPTPTRLSNISTRGRVGTGNDVLIGGFISSGTANSRFILRGIGPSLSPALVGTPLADPVLTLFDKNGVMMKTNDDWMTQTLAADLIAINNSGLAPSSTAEAAIFADLAPGAYTAIVSGKSGATGVALVEIFHLP